MRYMRAFQARVTLCVTFSAISLGIILGTTAPAFAQDEPREPSRGPFVFLDGDRISLKPDNSYLLQHTDGKLVFEAQIAPDVRIVDSFDEAVRHVFEPGKPRVFAYSIYGTFLTRLRMFDEDSNPVRTPSYMPKANIQLAWMKNLTTKKLTAEEATEFNRGPVEMWLIHAIPFGHHSNGQKGCLFRGQVRINGECEPPPNEDDDIGPDDINTEDGSFSTNYIRVGAEYRRLHTANDTELLRLVTRREWGIGGSVEFNPSGYIGGSISDSLKPLYGATRFQVAADALARDWGLPIWPGKSVTCGRAWINSSLTFLKGAADAVDPVIATVEAACLPLRWGGAGLFVRYYRGQDYYNAAFLENINRFQFGITFLPGKFLSFVTHPTTDD